MDTIYIHCGLHKTGTTALQGFLAGQRDKLRSLGFLYPHAGTLGAGTGHHNIAWELSGDHRFDAKAGDLNALFDEISGFSGNIVLSSEDFESSLAHTGRWGRLREMAAATNRSLALVVYLRNQASYMESLYLEMLKHGYGDDYDIYAKNILADGVLRMQQWEFHFDYSRMTEGLTGLAGVTVIFRNYHDLIQGSVLADFCSALRIPLSPPGKSRSSQANARADIAAALIRYYSIANARPANRSEKKAARILTNGWVRTGTARSLRDAIKERFLPGNTHVCKRHALSAKGMCFTVDPTNTTATALDMQKLFSCKTQTVLRSISQSRLIATGLGIWRLNPTVRREIKSIRAWWKNDSNATP